MNLTDFTASLRCAVLHGAGDAPAIDLRPSLGPISFDGERNHGMQSFKLTPDTWRGYRLDGFPADSWSVADGVLQANPRTQQISLISRSRYTDFDLSLEWCVPPAGNSGILYRVLETLAEPWQSGPEMQLLDDARHPDARRPQTACGALYDLLAPVDKRTLTAGIYHSARVVLRAGTSSIGWMAKRCCTMRSIAQRSGMRLLAASSKRCPGLQARRAGTSCSSIMAMRSPFAISRSALSVLSHKYLAENRACFPCVSVVRFG